VQPKLDLPVNLSLGKPSLAAGVAAVVLVVALVSARLLVLAPAGQDEFDPYFGTGGFALRRRLKMLVGRAAA
jgi:hypothetical protein